MEYGGARNCECTTMFTCQACLDESWYKTLAEHFAGFRYHEGLFDNHANRRAKEACRHPIFTVEAI